MLGRSRIYLLSLYCSYEALPPNFTAFENMLAGGFAGVAVNLPPRRRVPNSHTELMRHQEHSVMYPVDMLKVVLIFRDLFWLDFPLKLRRLVSKY